MLQLLIFLWTIGSIFGQTVHNEVVQRGSPYNIATDIGWKDGVTAEWNLQVESDAKLKVVCTDIRMTQRDEGPWPADCPDVYVSFEDRKGEKKVCGRLNLPYAYLSDGPKLKVKVFTSSKGSAVVKCVALNTGNPTPTEIIKLDPHDKLRRIEIGGTPIPNLDRYWVFESPSGTRMSFQCDLTMRNVKPVCGINSLRFYNGETEEEYCDAKHFVWFSKTNKASIRLQFDNYGYGAMKCLIQAVTGSKPDEYENVVIEEVDSSEHGVTPGTRQTSCKCGWANKGNARIFHGEEARVNEFPWMVHLHIDHEMDDGSYFSVSCGASIITPRHVLTAAHCLVINSKVAKPENLKMELAKHDSLKPTGKEIRINALKVFIRDIYLQKGISFEDIALIFTKETIDFSTPIVGPVCMEPQQYPMLNKPIIIMGWGLTEERGPSTYLRKGKSVVMDPYFCSGQAWDLCVTSKPSGFCSGDSGGPLVRLDKETNRYTQESLVSRGADCEGKYLISTEVPYFYDWIQEVIKATDPSVNTCHKI